MSETLELAQQLIQRPSVTPLDEGCQELIAKRLTAIGFSVETLQFEDVTNLWATLGSSGPLFVFAGHTDVVPTGPQTNWQYPPYSATVADGFLHGRGAADMKGSIAAMVTAVERFLPAAQLNARIGFLITSDEEGSAINGTQRVIKELGIRNIKIDYCLVGEPSSSERLGDTVKIGRRGSLGATLVVNGIQGHVAYPQLAVNPIHKVLPVLAHLSDITWDEGNASFPATSFQISNINAGTGATNVIPGQIEVVFNFRFSTELDADTIKSRVTQLLDEAELNYQLDWKLWGNPFLTDAGKLVEARLGQQLVPPSRSGPTRIARRSSTPQPRSAPRRSSRPIAPPTNSGTASDGFDSLQLCPRAASPLHVPCPKPSLKTTC